MRTTRIAAQTLMGSEDQQSYMVFEEKQESGDTATHCVQLFSNTIGTSQVVLLGNLTTVSWSCSPVPSVGMTVWPDTVA